MKHTIESGNPKHPVPTMRVSPFLTSRLGLRPIVNHSISSIGAIRIIDFTGSCRLLPINDQATQFLGLDAGNSKTGKQLKAYLNPRGLGLDAIVAYALSHGHSDHVGALHVSPGVPAYMGKGDIPILNGTIPSPGKIPGRIDKARALINLSGAAVVPDVEPFPLEDGESRKFGQIGVRAFAMPGHTAGSMGLFVTRGRHDMQGDFYAGDTLDIDVNGDVVSAAKGATEDVYQSEMAIVGIAKRIRGEHIRIDTLMPAHSGDGLGEALMHFAPSV